MGTELVAHFDVPTVEARWRFVEALLDLAGEQAAVSASLSRRPAPGSPPRRVAAVTLAPGERTELAKLVRRQQTEPVLTEVEVESPPDERWGIHANVCMNPPGFDDPECPHDLELECKAYASSTGRPPTGMTDQQHRSLTNQLYRLDIVQHLCAVNGVTRGYVLAEQRVFNPLCYRLMFHVSARAFGADLRLATELSLHGGARYGDERRSYEPLVSLPPEALDFCGRSHAQVAQLRERLKQVLPGLHERGVPEEAVTGDLVRRAAARSGRFTVFEDDADGLGVRGVPVQPSRPNHDYDQFPVAFLDEFYLDLAELLLGR